MLRQLQSLGIWLGELFNEFKHVNIKGKTIIVVGATGGIGRVLSLIFHKLGANVVMAARTEDRLRFLQDSLGEERTLIVQADATVVIDVKWLCEAAKKKFGSIDAVVISAGSWERLSIQDSAERALVSQERLFLSIYLPTTVVGSVAQEFFRRQGFGLI